MSGWISWLMTPIRALGSLPITLAGLSLAARIAALVAVFQVVVVLLAVAVLVVGEERQVIQAWLGRLPAVGLLLVLTPVVVYHAAKLWLEREASRFPDILEAWQAGLSELRRQGIMLADVPVFVVLGARSAEEEQRLLADAPCEFSVRAAPAGAAALHVYGGPDAVFICLDSCCQSSDVGRRGPGASSSPAPAAAPAAAGGGDVHGTVFIDSAAAQMAPDAAPAAAEPMAPDASRTIDVAQLSNTTIDISRIGVGPAAERPATTTVADRETMSQRLQYLCELLRRERGGLAPFNGALAIIPWSLARRGGKEVQEVGRALGDDLRVLVRSFGMRAPVTAVVLGLEQSPGFVELIRRMPGAERQSRLGQRFSIGRDPSYDELKVVATRACGMVEDLVMGRIFRAKGVLSEAGNASLAELVIRLRGEIAGGLTAILRRAFTALDGDSNDTLPYFAGCYLAACGPTAGERGFVRGVLEKLVDAQGDLEWTQTAEFEDAAASRAANVLWIVSGVVLAGVAAAVAWRLFGR